MLLKPKQNYLPINFYANKKFNPSIAAFCNAYISIDDGYCKFLIFNNSQEKIEMLAEYEIKTDNYDNFIDATKQIFNSYKVFELFKDKNLTITNDSPKFTLIPKYYFNENDAKHYLDLVCDTSNHDIKFSNHYFSSLTVSFAIPKTLSEWILELNNKFKCRIYHKCSAIIHGAKKLIDIRKNNYNLHFIIYVDYNYFYITIIQKDMLMLCNRFTYQKIDDILQQVNEIFKIFNLDPQYQEVICLGIINKESDLYKSLSKQYIKIKKFTHSNFLGLISIKLKNMEISYFDLVSARYI